MQATLEQPTALALYVQKSEVSDTQKQTLLESFSKFFEQTEEWKTKAETLVITSADQKDDMKLAREARLALKNIRVATEHKRKELKEESLRTGQTIDAIAKIITNQILPIEEHLEQQEKFIEIQENNRKEALREERLAQLAPYEVDATFYDLRNMPDNNFAELLNNSRVAYEARQEAARKAEEERIAREKAEAEERERVRIENERLRKEAEEREAQIAAERAEQEKQARIEREAAEAKAEQEKQKIKARCGQLSQIGLKFNFGCDSYTLNDINVHTTEITIMGDAEWKALVDKITPIAQGYHEEQEHKNREALAKMKADAEREAKEKADRLAQEQEALRAEAELSKGDKAKFEDLLADLQALKGKYAFKSKKYKAAYAQIGELLDKTINHAIGKTA